ncbi:MAG: hypothetical protein JWM87_3794 [Candidatus Eremiobacteraeota bacterium]|nr:hypothetical protein [Candidatus Eremiobacteraeota bacterium]
MQNTEDTGTRVNGRGVDADPKNDPTYPIRHRLPAEEARSGWVRPAQQAVDVEVLRSIEYPEMTAVFGTSTPPAGLSGMIRRAAFAYSESSYLHWLPLVLADRINVVEGILDDLRRGRLPNGFAEAGGKAQWRYNRRRLIGGTLVRAALAAVLIAYVRGRVKGNCAADSQPNDQDGG